MESARVVAFVNGELGTKAIEILGDRLVAVVLHPHARRRIPDGAFDSLPVGLPILNGPVTAEDLEPLGASHGLSVLYGYIFKADVLNLFPIANLHLSLLPYGRGANPNAWAIADGTPAGVTLHLVDEGIDTGPILAQRAVEVATTDTAKTLYGRLIRAAEGLLRNDISDWLEGNLIPEAQHVDEPVPTRRVRDLESMAIDPDRTYTGRQVIDILRSRTFEPFPGARYVVDGTVLRVSIHLEEEP